VTRVLDLTPAAARMAGLVEAVPEATLGQITPCEGYTVGALLDHIAGVALAFSAAAAKSPLDAAPSADAAALAPDWRTRIPSDLRTMAGAWRAPDAWQGATAAGGVDLPAELAGAVALDELVIHAWDLAVAIGAPVDIDGPDLEVVHETVQHFRQDGIEGIFGPAVPVAPDAPLLDRILGLSGRDPAWRAPGPPATVGG
jgi:uncharacterized protein (TIGR03086 family)